MTGVSEAERWDDVAAGWSANRGAAALRSYSDAVNLALLERWVTPPLGAVLKTDLFDEVVGNGLVPWLVERAERVVGVDVSPSVVRSAARRSPRLEPVVADVRALPFEDRSFDLVVSNSTLDHFATTGAIDEALRELARVLKPGGRLVVTLDNAANPAIWVRNRLPNSLLQRVRLVPYPLGATLRPGELCAAVARAGLAVEDVREIAHVPRLVVRLLALRSPRLVGAERAGAAPTSALTGQFVAVLATRTAGRLRGARSSGTEPHVARPTVERVLSATVLRRLRVLAIELEPRPSTPRPSPGLSFGFVADDTVGELEALRPGLGELARDRFAHGERCFAARAADGHLVSVRWVARGHGRIGFLGCALRLAPDEAYNFDTWTEPSARGHGVASATAAHLNELLAEEGVRRVLRAVWPANRNGLRNAMREGGVPIGTIASLRLGPLRRHVVRLDGGRATASARASGGASSSGRTAG